MLTPEQLLNMDLSLGGDDWEPTPHGRFLAEVLAERNRVSGKSVLEIGAGSGNHTVLLLRQGAARVVATEITAELLATTRRNVEHNCPAAPAVEYRVADWLNTDGSFEVIVTNPPFCKSGRRNRRYFIDSLILDGHKRLEPQGRMIFVQSSMADLSRTLRRLDENGYQAEVLAQREWPWRDYYFDDPTFLTESDQVPQGYRVENGVRLETLSVISARLRAWSPPDFAHLLAARGLSPGNQDR